MRSIVFVIFTLFAFEGFAAQGIREVPSDYRDFRPRDQRMIDHYEVRIKYLAISGYQCGVIYEIESGWSSSTTYKGACAWQNSGSLRGCRADYSGYARSCDQLAVQYFRIQRYLQQQPQPQQQPQRPILIPRSGPYNLPMPSPRTS